MWSTLSRSSRPQAAAADWEWPVLKAKAHNCSVVVRWLAAELEGDWSHDRPRRLMGQLFWCLAECDYIFGNGPQWLEDPHVERLKLARDVLFSSWTSLASFAEEDGRAGWAFVPKHHLVEHTLDDCIEDRRNPGGFWNYGKEHFMGDTKRAAGRNFQRELGRRILFALLSQLGIALDKL